MDINIYTTIIGNLKNEKMTADLKVKALNFLTICNYAIAHPSNDEISIHNLGDSINTAAPEYFPYFSSKDSVLFFMRNPSPDGSENPFYFFF